MSSQALRVVVTGANRGIGLELVRQYLEAGALVVAGARAPAMGELAALAARHGERLRCLTLDVTSEAQCAAAAAAVSGWTDAIDVLVNNAGRNAKGVTLASASAAQMTELLVVNAVAPVLVTQALLPLLRKAAAAKVVNVSSQVGSFTSNAEGRSPLYAAGKAALNMYTRALARELDADGVTVIAVHPGWVKTDMGGPEAPLAVGEAVTALRRLVARVGREDTGKFFDHDGAPHPF